jgi:hypothetical protein
MYENYIKVFSLDVSLTLGLVEAWDKTTLWEYRTQCSQDSTNWFYVSQPLFEKSRASSTRILLDLK